MEKNAENVTENRIAMPMIGDPSLTQYEWYLTMKKMD